MNHGLLVINMHAVVGHEDSGGSSIALSIDVLIKRGDGRERRGVRLDAILPGLESGQIRALDQTPVLPGASQGILQFQGRSLLGRLLCKGETRESEEQKQHASSGPSYSEETLKRRPAIFI